MTLSRSRLRQPLSAIAPLRRPYTTETNKGPGNAAITTVDVRSAQNYCSELLQKYDAPSSTLRAFVPPSSLPAYLAIRAFNLEVARIADTVSTPHVGQLRLQFWRDTVGSAFAGTPAQQPVAILLAHVLNTISTRASDGKPKAPLSKAWFMRIIDARAKYLDNRPFVSLSDLESYAENTYSTLLYLTLQSLPLSSLTLDHLASHVGKAAGIAAVLRGLPLIAFPAPPKQHFNSQGLSPGVQEMRKGSQRGSVVLPLDIMAECGVRDEDVLRQGSAAQGLKDAVFKVATRASDHLITARSMLHSIKKGEDVGHAFEHEGEDGHDYGDAGRTREKADQMQEVDRAFGVLMPAVSTDLWLRRLENVDFDIFNEGLRRREWRLPWKAWIASKRGVF